MNSLFSSKLGVFMELIERVKNLKAEPVVLKACLMREVTASKFDNSVVKISPKKDFIISGIPTDWRDSLQSILSYVFSVFSASNLSNEFQNIRIINSNSTVTTNYRRAQLLLPIVKHGLLVVALCTSYRKLLLFPSNLL